MVSPELERSSSSQSARISSLSKEGADGSVLRVHLEDGSLFLFNAFSEPALLAAAEEYLLSKESVPEHLLTAFKTADSSYACRCKAMNLLARAEQCRKGLTAKLAKKGFSQDVILKTLGKLESLGYLDDSRYAEAWTRSRLRSRPEGRSRLIGGLMAKGIASGTAKAAVEAVLAESGSPQETEREALERALEKLLRRSGMTEEKLLIALQRRGFSYSAIRDVLNRVSDS